MESIAKRGRMSNAHSKNSPLGEFLLCHLDFDIDSGGKIQVGERLDDLLAGVRDLNEALMDAEFELFARVLMDKSRTVHGIALDFGRKRNRSVHDSIIPFGRFYNLACRIVDQLVVVRFDAQAKFLCDFRFCHEMNYFVIFVTTPAPTVLPPSRMAKRIFSSRPTGLISLTPIFTVSPGMTISMFSGSATSPVTSVVRI